MTVYLKLLKIKILAIFIILITLLQSCVTVDVDSPSDLEIPNDPTLTALNVSVKEGVLNSTNNQIKSVTVVEFKAAAVVAIHKFEGSQYGWSFESDSWKTADSLVSFANLTKPDIDKIKVNMEVKLFNDLEFGGLGNIGAVAPFLMKNVVKRGDFTRLREGKIDVVFTPMVGYVSFKKPGAVRVDNIVAANVARHAIVSMSAIAGDGNVETINPTETSFGFYLYPTKEFTISISQGQATLTRKIEAINANSLITVDIEDAKPPVIPPVEPPVVPPVIPPVDPEPPVVPPVIPPVDPEPPITPPVTPPTEDKEYTLNLNNSNLLIKNGQVVTLPSKAGSLYAILNVNLDLKLQTTLSWVRIEATPNTKSRSLVASQDNELRFVVSFARRVFEQEAATAKYVFDNYFEPNAVRSANFKIVDRATQNVLAAFVATQVGEGNVEISTDNISPSVGTVVDGKVELKQIGGQVEFVVKSTSGSIKIDKPKEFTVVSESSVNINPSEFKHTLIYTVEPSNSTVATNFKLTVSDLGVNKSDYIDITQAALVMTADRKTLMEVYDKLGGDQWSSEAAKGWKSGYPLNEWSGVTTNSSGRVTAIELKESSNIKGAFPIEFTKLAALESLIIGANQITGSIPADIKNLKALKTFKTVGNKMGGDLPRSLGELSLLADLHIAGQYHTGQIWKEIQTIPAYKNTASFEEKVRKQLVAGTEAAVVLPLENSIIADSELRGTTLSKVAQSYIISLPSDVDATSFEYTSLPSGHTLGLAYKTSDIMVDNKTMLQATLPANTTAATITYNIKATGRNRTTGVVKNYTCKIEQTTEVVSRKDGDIRMFLDNNRGEDKSYGIVFMGDGFILEDLQPGGDYDKYANNVLSYIFSKEPFATYKDYFKIYIVYVESPKRGIGGKLGTWYNPSTTYPEINNNIVREYAQKASLYTFARLVAMNLYDPGVPGGMMVNAVNALFQATNESVALHEFGHTFNLGDEYDYGGYPGVKPNVRSIPNLDNTGNLNNVKWKHFIGRPGYEAVGAYEGGAYKPTGVWRPEKESIMKNYHKDFNHFNAPSREAIVKRVLDYSEEKYSFEEFLRLDKIPNKPK